ncbi:MAG: hypothetical protein MRK00_16315 [Nitrosomonas sp.]|nr:hypothetical protein [Nitrosomonas sp.]
MLTIEEISDIANIDMSAARKIVKKNKWPSKKIRHNGRRKLFVSITVEELCAKFDKARTEEERRKKETFKYHRLWILVMLTNRWRQKQINACL